MLLFVDMNDEEEEEETVFGNNLLDCDVGHALLWISRVI